MGVLNDPNVVFVMEVNIAAVCYNSLIQEYRNAGYDELQANVSVDQTVSPVKVIIASNLQDTVQNRNALSAVATAHDGMLCRKKTFTKVKSKFRAKQVDQSRLLPNYERAISTSTPTPIIGVDQDENPVYMSEQNYIDAANYMGGMDSLFFTSIDYSLYTFEQLQSAFNNHTAPFLTPPAFLVDYGVFG